MQQNAEHAAVSNLCRDDAHTLLAQSEEELFVQLVPEDERQELYSQEGIIARGRLIFRSLFMSCRDRICELYAHSDAKRDEVELLKLVAGVLISKAVVTSVPVIPAAALAVKIGLAQLCKQPEKDDA
ncbi:MAG TPA: hypothetical protein VF861_15010 [Telluria sp.]